MYLLNICFRDKRERKID